MNGRILVSLLVVSGWALTPLPLLSAHTFPPVVTQKLQAAPKQVKTIAMEDYRAVGDHPGDALIIDVRELQEYAAGHVPGAVNIPRGVLEFQIWKHVGSPAGPQMATPLYLQCQSGNRASLAAQFLAELGLTHTTAVVMSLKEWQKSGQPFVK